MELLQDVLHPQRHGVGIVPRRVAVTLQVITAKARGEVLQLLGEVTHLQLFSKTQRIVYGYSSMIIL